MSIELKDLANLVEIAEHDATLDERCDYLDTIAEHLDALKAILARMQALEKVAVAASDVNHWLVREGRLSGTPRQISLAFALAKTSLEEDALTTEEIEEYVQLATSGMPTRLRCDVCYEIVGSTLAGKCARCVRMQALEKAVASVAAIRSRFSSTPMMNGTVQFAGFHKGDLGGSSIHDELTAMDHAFAAIRKS